MKALLVLMAAASCVYARDLHVDPAAADDKGDGLAQPVKTIAHAIRLAQPGDTIHLAPGAYHESAEFGKRSGEEGKPIVLDGHGAILDGSEPVLKKDWEQISPGLYRRIHLLPKVEAFMIQRWFMLWDGKMNHMGRTSKGHQDPLKKPVDLQPGEWTYVVDEDAFYVRIAPEGDLDEAHIRFPARSSGVALGGASHIVVRNVTATHVFNDGFNVHGSVRDARFEDIRAIECGDDGFSAHEDAECEIDGLVSIGNSTGFTDINSSKTHYRLVYLEGNLGCDILFQGDGDHSVVDGRVISSVSAPLGVSPGNTKSETPCRCRLENVYFEHQGKPLHLKFPAKSDVKATRCSFFGFTRPETSGVIALEDCAFAEKPEPSAVGADLVKLKELGLFSKP